MLEEHFERGKRGAPATSCRLGGEPAVFFNSRCELSCVRQTEDGREGGSPEDRSGFDRVVRSHADRERSERGRPDLKCFLLEINFYFSYFYFFCLYRL